MVRPVTDELATAVESVEELEQRVRRLEDAVAALQDTQLMEDRVAERIVQRLEHAPRPALDARDLILDAPRMLLPKTVEPLPEEESTATGVAAAVRSSWLVMDVVREFRAMFRMLTDYRYRMTWAGRLVLLVAVGVAVLSWLVLSGNFFGVGTVVDRVILVVAAVVAYKVLSRETQRYQELLARVGRYR